MKKLVLIVLVAICSSGFGADFDKFCAALSQVESSGNQCAFNKKENAVGLYQIRPLYFKDAKEFSRALSSSGHESCYNEAFARKTILAYFGRYEPRALKNNDWQTLARLHNAGPNWRKKSTDAYWLKVKKELTSAQ